MVLVFFFFYNIFAFHLYLGHNLQEGGDFSVLCTAALPVPDVWLVLSKY